MNESAPSGWPPSVTTIREIAAKYRDQKITAEALARHYGHSSASIKKLLREIGVELRTRRRTGENIPRPVGLIEQALGRQMRALREGAGYDLITFAKLMKRNVNTIRWHEAGSRMMRLGDIVRAAAILGVEPGQLCVQAGKRKRA
jgi:biotin operon repressor